MSALEQVSKLETLLARIRSRAEAPREIAAVPTAEMAPAVAPQLSPPPPRAASVAPEPPPRVASIPPEAILAGQVQTSPPPSMGSVPPPMSEAPPTQAEMDAMDVDAEMDVEVSSEIVEVDIDVDEPAMADAGFPRESGALLIAEQARAPIEEPVEESVEELSESIPPAEPAANEVVEPAPSSSPRAIESYETTPRHTPPPESGKQVAAASVKPDPRMSSAPPPPSEGHTLMGGWREPGMPLRSGEARPGVRVPPPPPPPPPADLASAPPPPPPASIAAKALTADATVPMFPPFNEVGIIESPASSFAPATFGDLLDASLSL